ncbi:MAG: hypothetical protein JSU61_06740 [Fidelibacterota bacterium]|nr:MAG: hypothetical protein JSU61_06740 [Candidatus Neomarinimicrobiota bacterium]
MARDRGTVPASEDHDRLLEKLQAIRALAEESEALLRGTSGTAGVAAETPDMEKLMATLQAQAKLQQVLLEKLLELVNPTEIEKDLSDSFQRAVEELLDYFRERVRLQLKVADAAALDHLRKG